MNNLSPKMILTLLMIKFPNIKRAIHALAGLAAFRITYPIIQFLLQLKRQRASLKLAQKHKQTRNAIVKGLQIGQVNKNKEQIENILNSNVNQLAQMLQKGEVTSVELLNIYAARVQKYGLELDLITETNYDQALQQAQLCDNARKSNPQQIKNKSELYGIPMSIKDSFDLANFDSTVGCISKLNKPLQEDGLTVKLLKAAGAIIFVKTNVPQCAMHWDSINNIWGQCKNPWDKTRTCGGSSGGEGGVIASRCAPIGIGSDIGGSIRIPAAMCGIVGFKPTAGRCSYKGHTYYCDSFQGQTMIKPTLGPMCKSVDDCVILMKALLDEKVHENLKFEKDYFTPINNFNENIYKQNEKLTIGYYKGCDILTPTLANRRAIDEAVQVLKDQGHTLVEINYDLTGIFKVFIGMLTGDKLKWLYDMCPNEPFIDFYTVFTVPFKLPQCARTVIAQLLKLVGQPRAAQSLEWMKEKSAYEWQKETYNLQVEQEKFLKFWASKNLDAVVSPSMGCPAVKNNDSIQLGGNPVLYTVMWNVLNFPTGSMPITTVQEDEQSYNEQPKDLLTKIINDNMKEAKGLPVGVQVSTLPYEEEKCLRVMKQIEDGIKFYEKNPLPQLN